MRAVHALERFKDAFRLIWRKANTVIGDTNDPLVSLPLGGYMDTERLLLLPKFEGVAKKVLKKPHHLASVHLDIG